MATVLVRLERMTRELRAAGLPVVGTALRDDIPSSYTSSGSTSSFHAKETKFVRIDWVVPPTSEQLARADALVLAHRGSPTLEEKLIDGLVYALEALPALVVRSSSQQFAKLTGEQKSQIEQIIERAAQKLLAP